MRVVADISNATQSPRRESLEKTSTTPLDAGCTFCNICVMSSSTSPLRTYRDAAGLTLEQLADRFGVNKTTVMRWEDGKVPPLRVLLIERKTGIHRSALRPDVYPPNEGAAA